MATETNKSSELLKETVEKFKGVEIEFPSIRNVRVVHFV